MANDIFKFKQFSINQDLCAMKVTTLACIQGAWLPEISPKKILDIGAGTGLLTLMAAQKYRCEIDAVEIEERAYTQLCENVYQSPWSNRINCYHNNVKQFAKENTYKYDFIISNPPFFQSQLNSDNPKINLAKHEHGLTLKDLVSTINQLMKPEAIISVLLPIFETNILIEICKQYSFSVSDQLIISDAPGKTAKTIVSILQKKDCILSLKDLTIKCETGSYSEDFIDLLKDYYLYL